MTDREVWHVMVKNATKRNEEIQFDKWKVMKESNQGATKVEDTKSEAIGKAKEVAKNNRPSKVIVHKTPRLGMNGNILHPINKTYSWK